MKAVYEKYKLIVNMASFGNLSIYWEANSEKYHARGAWLPNS